MSEQPMVDITDLTAYQTGDPQKALDRAIDAARRFCGWHVAPSRTETVQVPSSGARRVLFLPSLLVTAVTAVRVDGVLVGADEYSWTAAGVLTKAYWYWPCGTIEVDLVHGYTDTPKDLAGVIMARATREESPSSKRIASRTRGPFAESYAPDPDASEGWEGDELATLRAYRIPGSR